MSKNYDNPEIWLQMWPVLWALCELILLSVGLFFAYHSSELKINGIYKPAVNIAQLYKYPIIQ